MTARYPVPAGVHRVEQTIQRSRFITTVARASDADAARAFLDGIREEFLDRTNEHGNRYNIGRPILIWSKRVTSTGTHSKGL